MAVLAVASSCIASSSGGPYILTRDEDYTAFPSNGETMLHYDLWMIPWKTPGAYNATWARNISSPPP